ncbi:hypothetical protein [Streptomyces sp. NPDC058240]
MDSCLPLEVYGSAKGGGAPGRQRRANSHGAQGWPIERHLEAPEW